MANQKKPKLTITISLQNADKILREAYQEEAWAYYIPFHVRLALERELKRSVQAALKTDRRFQAAIQNAIRQRLRDTKALFKPRKRMAAKAK